MAITKCHLPRAAKTDRKELALAGALAEVYDVCRHEPRSMINARVTDWVEHYAGYRP